MQNVWSSTFHESTLRGASIWCWWWLRWWWWWLWWGAGLRHQIDESFKPGRVFTTFDFMLVAGEYGVPGLCRTSRLIASTGVHTRGTPHKRYMISTYPALYCCLRFHRVSSTHSYSSVSVYGMLPILHHPLGEDVETFSLRQSSM